MLGVMDKSGELWSTKDISEWLGVSMAAAYALVSGSDFPLPVRGLSHSRRWSQTVVRSWVTTPRFQKMSSNTLNEGQPARPQQPVLGFDQSAVVVRPIRQQNRRTT
jgi:predicted DNA-binding transcriptional regulator AlpA